MTTDKRTVWNSRLGPNKAPKSYRTHCKIGKHPVYDGDPTVWLTNPMGISCKPCAEAHIEEVAA
jgi:hypothetical protein